MTEWWQAGGAGSGGAGERRPPRSASFDGAEPDTGPVEPAAPPMHPALKPRGEAVAWSALGSLLAGPLVWGGVGFLADRWLGTGRILTAIGVVVGSLAAFYIVYLRFGRDDGTASSPSPQTPRSRKGPSC